MSKEEINKLKGTAAEPILDMAPKPVGNVLIRKDFIAPKEKEEEQKEELLHIYTGKPVLAMAKMNNRKAVINEITKDATFTADGVNLFIRDFLKLRGNLGVNTYKLLLAILVGFTRNNSKEDLKSNTLDLQVLIPFKEYCCLCGKTNVIEEYKETAAEREKEAKRVEIARKNERTRIRKELKLLKECEFNWDESDTRLKGVDRDISIIGSREVNNDYIEVFIDQKFAEYLVKTPITAFPPKLFLIDGRNSTALEIAMKLNTHYFIDNNIKNGTNNRIKVKNILAATTLPTYEKVREDRKSWEDKLKEPLENALEYLWQIGFLEDKNKDKDEDKEPPWEYCKPGGESFEDEKASFEDYNTWANTLIHFEINTAQVEKRKVKIKERKQKALKDKKKNNKKEQEKDKKEEVKEQEK